jgi:hypothetical protein
VHTHTTQTKTGGSVPLPRVGGALSARSLQYQGTAASMSNVARLKSVAEGEAAFCRRNGLPVGQPLKMEPWHSLSLRGWRLPVAAFLTGRHGSCAFPMRFVTSNSDGRSGWGLHSTRPVAPGLPP